MPQKNKVESLASLVDQVKRYHPDAEGLALITRAYKFSDEAHRGQYRLSKEPYITHPLAVAHILANMEQHPTVIAASLLHDTLEDSNIPRETIAKDFGEEVASLVDGVTKLGHLEFQSQVEMQAENFRKMFLAMAEDIRVIIIKLADRLHNMRTLKYLNPARQRAVAIETKEIFAPLAHRLGIWNLKWELEDLCFYFLDREAFLQIKERVAAKREERENEIHRVVTCLEDVLQSMGIAAKLTGRPKHFFSIHEKIVDQHLVFDEVYDLLAVRVLVDSIKDCYAVLGAVHSEWRPIPGRFKDYIAMPKSNGYQSLHTTVVGEHGRPVEIQIRTHEMHRIAEHGIAAHWRYKEKEEGGGQKDRDFEQKLTWLRQLIEWQKDLKSAKDFMDSLKIDLFTDEVFVFTPKGHVVGLPVGATPIDFAYHVHTEVGHRCVGAKVNGRVVPLGHTLHNGDIIEILTDKTDHPRLDWLSFVKTSQARNRIKQWFRKQKREENLARGEELYEMEKKRFQLEMGESVEPALEEKLLASLKLARLSDLHAAVGHGEFSSDVVGKRLRELFQKRTPEIPHDFVAATPSSAHKDGVGVRVAGAPGVMVRFSRCCNPLPGDEIFGFVTRGRGVSLHRSDCRNATKLATQGERVVPVEWDATKRFLYPIQVEVEVFDRIGVLKDILAQVAETATNVSEVRVRSKRGSSALIDLTIDIHSVEHLQKIFHAIRQVQDVYDVYRISAKKN